MKCAQVCFHAWKNQLFGMAPLWIKCVAKMGLRMLVIYQSRAKTILAWIEWQLGAFNQCSYVKYQNQNWRCLGHYSISLSLVMAALEPTSGPRLANRGTHGPWTSVSLTTHGPPWPSVPFLLLPAVAPSIAPEKVDQWLKPALRLTSSSTNLTL